MIKNPILTGSHPDPSICRVGNDYYIATSTFEWWPAVRIHHSRDLVHWNYCTYAITRSSQLNLQGRPDSAGVWAPCLSYSKGNFWLIYTDVRSMHGAYKDTHNFLITAPTIEGPWSEPVYLNSSGFDPSLFHDEDGKTWLVNQQWSHLPQKNSFNGILLQEYSHADQKLLGPVKNIFKGTALGLVEGPHLYQRKGWYYLLTAEGGTGFEHAVTVARARHIDGPYETMPQNPLLTSHQKSPEGLQRSGHASLVQTPFDEWYVAHLCGRPLEWNKPNHTAPKERPIEYHQLHCNLGRETALQKINWRDDDWPEIVGGTHEPQYLIDPPRGIDLQSAMMEPIRNDFDSQQLNPNLNSLRCAIDESWLSLTQRRGFLRLRGRESLMSLFEQSLIAHRQQHFCCRVETCLDFKPAHFQQMAGLVAYYNTLNHAYLHITADDHTEDRVLRLSLNQDGELNEVAPILKLSGLGSVRLAVEFNYDIFQFFYAEEGQDWKIVGPALSAKMLSDEYATRQKNGYFNGFGFTGNFIGLACQDLAGTRQEADFDYFIYQPL
jgi:xylan 1,4-beta-xylosidase